MKKQLYFFIMIFLALAQHGWSQCSIVYSVSQSDKFEVQGDSVKGEITVLLEDLTADPFTNYGFNPDPALPPGKTGSIGSASMNTATYKVPYSYACGSVFPFEGLVVEVETGRGGVGCDTTFTVALTSTSAGDCGGTTVNDSRQIGQLIEGLGDGNVVELNGDGNILAFSSANGMYVCELVGETWTPIGGEIILDTIGGIDEIFLSTDGNTIWVDSELGIGCIYRNGSNLDIVQGIASESLFGETIFNELIDVSGNGSYVLARGTFTNSENGSTEEEWGCYTASGQGQLTRQVSLEEFELGFLSENGEYFCISNTENLTTTIYNGGDGSEVSTFNGIVLEASGDLFTCIITSDGDLGFISRWDGGTTFVSSAPFPISNIEGYGFSNTGNACVGLNFDGTVELSTFTEVDGSLQIEQTSYTVEGLTNITAINISGDGERLIFSNGPDNAVCVYRSELMFAPECGEWVLEGIGAISAKSNISPDGFIQGSYTYAPSLSGRGTGAVNQYLWEDGSTAREREVGFSYQQGDPHPLDGETISLTVFESEICSSEVELILNFPLQIGQVVESGEPGEELGRTAVAIDGDGETIAFSRADGSMVICALENNRWVEVSEPFEGGSSGEFSIDGSTFVSGNNCAYRNVAGTYDIIEVSGGFSVRSVSGDGTGVFFSSFGSSGYGRWTSPGVIEEVRPHFLGADEEKLSFAQVSTNGNYYCYTIRNSNDENSYISQLVEANTGEVIVNISGVIESASGDLSTCIISTIDSNTGERTRQISRWDGGTSFIQEPFSGGGNYSFNGDGSYCVGNTPEGGVECTQITFDGGAFSYNTEVFSVRLNDYANAQITDSGNRFIVGTGSSERTLTGGDDPRLVTNPTGSNITVFSHIELDSEPMADCDMDGVLDENDLDDDNDGILDTDECPSATDYSQTQFGPSNITILTAQGDEINVSVGSMVTDDALFDIGFPNSFNLDRGSDNLNEFKITFPFEVKSLRITAIDFDSDAFGDPTEWMDNFSIFPTEIIGDGGAVEDGFSFGSKVVQGRGITPDSTNGIMELFWNDLPDGTSSISWNNNRTTMDLDINFQIDHICYDLDGDGIPNHKDPDSDGDNCADAIEAGHTDPDGDGVLGNSPVTVDASGLVTEQGGYTGIIDAVLDSTMAACISVCEACPGDMTPPVITCPEDVTLTSTEFANLENGGESIFGGFESEYMEADTSLGDQAITGEGTWVVTNNPNLYHFLFVDCDDADGNPDGDMLVFNGAPEIGVSVYCQNVEVVAGITYNMTVMAASVLEGSPAMIQFAVNDEPQGEIHTATFATCEWTELTASWTAIASGSARICILNQNNATGGNDFALDNFAIIAEDGTEIEIGTTLGAATATDDCGPVTPTFVDSEVVSECETIITRTWTAVDSCGNQSTCEQIITVTNDENPACSTDPCEDCTDTTPPVFDDFDVFIEGECGEISVEALGITATDNCGTVTITFEETKFSPGCLGTLQRTYTATDNCGNTSTAIQIIDLTNENGPIMECLVDASYDCIADVPVAVDPVVTHGCDLEIVSIELNETMQGENCAMTITREWTATDACGGVSTCVQTITVNDNEAPGPPADAPGPLAVQCADDVPAAAELTAVDNCSGTVRGVPTDVVTPGDCPNNFVVTRTWTFTDECGNASAVSQTITVNDTEAPVAPEAPGPLAVQCADDVPAAIELTATDNCSGTITGVPTDIVTPRDCPNSFIVTRTWTFTDECDNASTISRTITVQDTEAPVLSNPPTDVTIECGQDIPTYTPEWTDNCGTFTEGATSGVGIDTCAEIQFFSYTATDECGNTSSVSWTITIEDTTAPVTPEAPAPLAVQCADDVPAAAELTAADICNGTVTGVPTDVVTPGDCPNSFVVTRTWTFTDECGNASTLSRTITVEDTEAPVAPEAPGPLAVQCADDVPAAVDLTAQDNCSGSITGVPTDVVTPGDCPNSFVVTRTWTFTDECDNASTVSQTITVEDTEAPVAPEAPAPLAAQCAEDVPAAAELTAQDNCSGTITGVPTDVVTPGDCPNSFVVTRTWTFADECDNSSTVSQIITIEDTEAPVLSNPPTDVTIECGQDIPTYTPEWTDNCGTFTEGATSGVGIDTCAEIQFFTYTATDECGNTSSVSWTITIEDTEAPVTPEAPAPLAVQCADDVPAAAELTAADICNGTVTGVPTDVVTPGDCSNSFVVTRTWTFTDDCGNASTVSQVITVADTEAPVLSNPPTDVTIECGQDIPTYTPEWTDNCGTFTEGATSGVGIDTCAEIQFFTYTATDECGNTSSVSWTITIEDTEAPVTPEAPAPLAVQCADDVPAAIELTAADICNGTITGVPVDVVTPGDCPNSFVVTRTWTFTDECSNASTLSRTITVEDTEAPVAPEAPAPLVVQCADDVPAATELTAADNCSGTITGVPVDVVTAGDCPNSFVVTRTWTFTDECDNVSTLSRTITIEDTEAPVAPEAPAPLVVQCADDVPAATELTAADNCSGTITGVPVDVVTAGDCPNNFVVTRTWTFTDECGNASTVSRTITVADTEAPVLSNPPTDVTIECGQDIPTYTPEWTDNCGTITETASSGLSFDECTEVQFFTYTATDECGNTSSTSWTITIEDTTAPVAPEAPTPLAVQCADEVPAAIELTAADNCNGAIIGVPVDVVTPGDCPNSFVVTRTWTFTDECGNASTLSRIITVEDTEAPVGTAAPAPVTIECDEEIPSFEPVWTDNCDNDLEIEMSEAELPNDCGFTYVKTFRAEDNCGNATTITQIVVVTDTQAPTFIAEPVDTTVECLDDVPVFITPEATDNCQVPEVTCVETADLDECGNGIITITCTADDGCGNLAITSYTITVNDTTAPELVGVPADLVLDCSAEVPEVPVVTAIDNCDNDVTVTFTETIIDSLPVNCVLSQPAEPCHDTENWSMVLFDLPQTEYFSTVEANFVEFPDGTAHLTGTVSDNTNLSGGFIIDVMFEKGMNWEEWSSQDFFTSFKDECGTGNNEDWTYYLITPGEATLTGYGNLAGSQFNLIHAPVNKIFAYQVGVGASNVNSNFGNGGWFIAQGNLTVDGQNFPNLMVAGDFAFDQDCCPSYELERTWTATDCSGNTSEIGTQRITFDHIEGEEGELDSVLIKDLTLNPNSDLFKSDGADITLSKVAPNPASDHASFSYVVNQPMHVMIDIIDTNGSLVTKVFEGNASSNFEHVHQIQTGNMTSGIYLIRVTSEKKMTFTKLVVVK